MSMDREPMKVSKAMELATRYYDENTYAHAMRVAGYVAQNMHNSDSASHGPGAISHNNLRSFLLLVL